MKYCCSKKKVMKIIMVPYPAQGHVTPMLKLALAFQTLGFQPVLVVPEFIYLRVQPSLDPDNTQISCIPIPDGLELDSPRDFFSIEHTMENNMPSHLDSIVRGINEEGVVVACMVVDLLASWAIQVAHRFRIPVAGFWPAMLATYCLIAAIPDLLRSGYISDTGCPQNIEKACFLPNQAILSTEDLPWLIGSPASRESRFKFWKRTLERSITVKWILVNSFPAEHYIDIKQQYCDHLIESSDVPVHHQPLVYPVGPLSKHATTTKKNPSFWEEDMSCLEWLDEQNPNSVMYISFGSWVSPIGEGKVRNLALSLEALRLRFIWVLGFGWREGLPCGFLERVRSSNQGKVVSWAPQMKVLQHKAVGCYLTHCGWNSTMEAIESQKRLLCYPVAGDQFVNCAHIVKIWKIGVKLNGFGDRDIEEAMKRAMEDGEMKIRLMRLHTRIMGEEAKSRVMSNLTAFVHDLNNLIITNHYDHSLKDVNSTFNF